MKKLLYVFLLLASVFTLVACKGSKGNGVLVVGYDPFSEKFSPFFATTAYDQDVVTMTSLGLMTTDRDGGIIYNSIAGETVKRGNTEHFYQGWTDLKVDIDEANDITTYTIKIKEDVKFADGHVVDADDIIFSYYVYLDPYYSGSTTLNGVDIVGYQEYKYNNENISEGKEKAESWVENIGEEEGNSAELDAYVLAQMKELLQSEYDWVVDDVITSESYKKYWRKVDGTAAATQAEASATATFAYFYAIEDGYSVVGKDVETVVNEVSAQYGYDYKGLDGAYGAPVVEPKVNDEALRLALLTLPSEPVNNVSGIVKKSQTEVEVKVNGFDAAAIYQVCGITVSPMHYYGTEAEYNYAENKFGFPTRTKDAMKPIETKTAKPLGAGPYKFLEFKDNVVYFEANEYYFKGEPKIKNINFQVVTEDAKVTGISTGEIDISNPSGSKTTFLMIAEQGDAVKLSAIDNLGYGYLGINALNVKVGTTKNDIGTAESKALRKAFATVLASYRYTANNSYYGQAAQTINYPISNTSWAAPKATDTGYQYAFAKNPDGSNVYGTKLPTELTDSERSAAAKASAKLWLEAAGYTFVEKAGAVQFGGKLWTATAPVGAKLEYEFIVPAGGNGDHPAFAIITQFKNIMAELGVTININDPSNSNVLWDKLDALGQEMWAAAWGSTIDPDMYQVYHSSATVDDPTGTSTSNHYYIKDQALDTLIMEARQSPDQEFRKGKYKQALDIIMDWAVEVPNYQRQNCILFSTERIDVETITPDITTYWGWMNDIEKLELK